MTEMWGPGGSGSSYIREEIAGLFNGSRPERGCGPGSAACGVGLVGSDLEDVGGAGCLARLGLYVYIYSQIYKPN